MKRSSFLLLPVLLAGCFTFRTPASMEVLQFKSIEDMETHGSCEALGPVWAKFDVFLHSPAGRKRAGRIRLKDAAHEKGANAVIMTSNDWGVITDQVQGVGYLCTIGDESGPAVADDSAQHAPEADPAERLRRLEVLREEGLISDAEYERKRFEIIDQL